MDPIALLTAGSLLVAIVSLGLAFATTPVSAQMRTRLQGVLSGTATSSGERVSSDTPLRARAPGLAIFQNIISGAWMSRMETQLRLADSQLHPGDFLAIRVAAAGIGFAAPFIYRGGGLGLLMGVIAGFAGFMLPALWINQRVGNRNKMLEQQLPEALTMIANSLKAGFGLLQALSLAAEQLEHPISTELAKAVQDTNIGSGIEEAFLALSERNQNYDLDLVVTAVLVQRTAGGNLSEILGTVAMTMRERVRIKGEIKTLTAQQTLTGIVIAMLPVGVGVLFLFISPDYIRPLFSDPMGRVMLIAGAFMEVIGVVVIKKILAIEV